MSSLLRVDIVRSSKNRTTRHYFSGDYTRDTVRFYRRVLRKLEERK